MIEIVESGIAVALVFISLLDINKHLETMKFCAKFFFDKRKGGSAQVNG